MEKKIGYTFQKKEYCIEALRHSSYANENKQLGICSNERLEFLGDSVLSLVTSSYLFGLFSEQPEGDLTKLRADLVCTRSLSHFARKIHLGDYVLLGNGQEHVGGRDQDKILEDAFEALLAAIYLDSGKELDIKGDTLCVHGDGPKAIAFVKRIREEFEKEGIEICTFR